MPGGDERRGSGTESRGRAQVSGRWARRMVLGLSERFQQGEDTGGCSRSGGKELF